MFSMSKKAQPQTKAQNEKSIENRSYLFFFYFGFLTLVFPLVHYSKILDIVMMPRLFSLSIFMTIFGVLFYFWARKRPEALSVLRNRIFLLFGLWILASVVSLLLSSNPVEGIFDIVKALFLPTIILWTVIMVQSEPDGVKKMTRFVILAGLIISAIAFWQYFIEVFKSGEKFFDEYGRQTPIIYKVRGLMAHKNLLSIALGLILPFSLFGILKLEKSWKILSVFVSVSIFILIVLLQTRAIWVGTMAAVGVSVLVLMFHGKKFGVGRKWQIAIVATGILGIIAVVSVLFLSQGKSNNPYIKQLQSITNPQSKQNIHRINIWKTTLDMIPEKPVFGYGPGNWKLHAPKFHNGRFTEENELNWQRPHNDFLWVLAEKGLVGFLIYLGIFAFVFYFLIAVIRKSVDVDDKKFALLLIFGLSMYLAASFFDFPYERVFHQTYLGIIFAVSLVLFSRTKENTIVKLNPAIVTLPLLVTVFGVVYAGQCINQEKHLVMAREHSNYISNVAKAGRQLPAQETQHRWKAVLDNAQKAQKPLKNLDPQANPIYSYEGLAYVNLGDFKNGIRTLKKAHKQHPGNIGVLNNLGAAYFKLEKYDEALEYLQKSYKIFPSRDAVINLSAVLYKMERYKEAYDIISSFPEKERTEVMNKNLRAIERILKKEE
jgi:O-antigen ligase